MKRKFAWSVLAVALSCTYKEYNTYEAPRLVEDAGSSAAGHGGTSGGSGGVGGASGSGGEAGSVSVGGTGGSAGSGVETGTDCTGCARVGVLSNRVADYRLELPETTNLSNTVILARIRIRDYVGDVYVSGYLQSGNQPEEELTFGGVPFNTGSGWQTVGIDLSDVDAFRAGSFIDGGGFAGSGFDSGFPFNKRRVDRIGLRIAPSAASGVFTPATVELDSFTFSDVPALNVDFSTNVGGFALVDSVDATATFVRQ
jgi:hypothetical protein